MKIKLKVKKNSIKKNASRLLKVRDARLWENIIVTIILVDIEVTIIQTIIFEFENMYLFSMSFPKRTL